MQGGGQEAEACHTYQSKAHPVREAQQGAHAQYADVQRVSCILNPVLYLHGPWSMQASEALAKVKAGEQFALVSDHLSVPCSLTCRPMRARQAPQVWVRRLPRLTLRTRQGKEVTWAGRAGAHVCVRAE